MGVGLVAGWLFVILGLSYYIRGRIGPQRWRKLHRFTALAWVLGVGHALMMGTDAGAAWFLLAAALVVIPAAALLVRRLLPARGDGMSHQTFDCFGSRCGVWVTGDARPTAVADARRCLENWHLRFSRFRPTSELSRLNADPREVVPVSTTMTRCSRAVREAAEATGGLVDGTLLGEIEAAGYRGDLAAPLPLRAGAAARAAAPAGRPEPARALARGLRRRLGGHAPAGLGFDSGGLAKGLFADLLAERLAGQRSFAVDCGGDLRFAGPERRLEVADPFGGPPLHAFALSESAVATSGIGRRSWLGPDGRPAHHLLDPATGAPAFTGVVQATALAPTAVEAEWRAKAAVLSGPDARRRLARARRRRRARRRPPLRRIPTHESLHRRTR